MSSREEQMPFVVGGEKNKAAHLSYIQKRKEGDWNKPD